jgi:hypothetical protein
MTSRLLVSLASFALISSPGSAATWPDFNAKSSTWHATHIVVVESGKVIESWKGDLKVGKVLPDGAARFARIPVPGHDPGRLGPGEKPPKVSGNRMVLFLAHKVPFGVDTDKPEWLGAHWPSYPFNRVTAAADIAWLEGDRVYRVVQSSTLDEYAIVEDGGVAGLKQLVDLGLALRAQFEAAKADIDRGRRADRLGVIAPVLSAYVRSAGSDCVWEVSRSGKVAIPHLARWIAEPKGEYWSEALLALGGLGDDGFDAALRILDNEAKFWKSIAAGIEPFDWVDQYLHRTGNAWRGPHRLRMILQTTQRMKLSNENRERLRDHSGLKELDKTLDAPGMKPDRSEMVEAHKILKDILAGKFKE